MKVKARTPKLEIATLLANKLVEGLISDEKNDDVRQRINLTKWLVSFLACSLIAFKVMTSHPSQTLSR